MVELRNQDKIEYRRILDEIGEDYCPSGTYCIFKEFLVSAHPSRRLLVQLKCVDKLKFIKSQEAGEDIGWDIAMQAWIDEGHAKNFAVAYSDKKSVRDIFRQTLNGEHESND